jgi:hypothetical protein
MVTLSRLEELQNLKKFFGKILEKIPRESQN